MGGRENAVTDCDRIYKDGSRERSRHCDCRFGFEIRDLKGEGGGADDCAPQSDSNRGFGEGESASAGRRGAQAGRLCYPAEGDFSPENWPEELR